LLNSLPFKEITPVCHTICHKFAALNNAYEISIVCNTGNWFNAACIRPTRR
jgi:hypothetical protein